MNTPISMAGAFEIDGVPIGNGCPVYFIADIAANHDGSLERAIELIYLAAAAGANAAKFQHFEAKTIVSDLGFKELGQQQSHQSGWKKSVYEVYRDATVSLSWTEKLRDACKDAGITFFTSPYSIDIVDFIDPYVPAYKIGSGDITWIELIRHIASKNKPYILATGASSIQDVCRAVYEGVKINPNLCLMQCNTNYTAELENFKYIHLNVLNTYRELFPNLILGLSDHTPGISTTLGAVALGARVVEKHFTDDPNRVGPDHLFSMDPISWREMVSRTRELEAALGGGFKKVEDNECDTVVIQRRCIRAAVDLSPGDIITSNSLTVLRPCPRNALPPYVLEEILNKKVKQIIRAGEHLTWGDIE